MNDRSALRNFIAVRRKFGLVVAMKVTVSKLRGILWPALALPGKPLLNPAPRQVTIMLTAADHSPASLNAMVQMLTGRTSAEWDLCVNERAPVDPAMAHALTQCRGTCPRLRIVTTDGSVNDATAARWTVEQATGEFIAVLAPGHPPDAHALSQLIDRLRNDPAIDAAAAGTASADCRMVLQRKASYLASAAGHWHLSAPALARHLDGTAVPIAYTGPTSN